MAAFFYLLLNAGIVGSAVGLVVLAVRALGRRMPPAARCLLWLPVLLRLAMPVSVPSRASIFNPVALLLGRPATVPLGGAGLATANAIGAADRRFPLVFHSAAVEAAFHWAGWVWLAGAAAALCVLAVLWVMTARRFAGARSVAADLARECRTAMGMRRAVPVLVSDATQSPVVFGLFQPRVVIPPTLAGDPETLRCVLLHEFAHIRRGDHIVRALSALLLCVHWFNPLAWVFFRLMGRDLELACDGAVLRRLDRAGHRGYAEALARLALDDSPVLATAFGRSAVRQRILAIARWRPVTASAVIGSALLLVALAVVLLTNPMGATP